MSQKASGFERQNLEKYYTPAWVVNALLSKESFNWMTIDPASGANHIINALKDNGISGADGFDIDPEGHDKRADFLAWDGQTYPWTGRDFDLITNPPYGKGGRLAVRFIEHALVLASSMGGKVAMLLRVDFDSANGRRHIFADHPAFKAKYVLTKRIRWENLPQSAAGPTENHAWFVWDYGMPVTFRPTIGYLP